MTRTTQAFAMLRHLAPLTVWLWSGCGSSGDTAAATEMDEGGEAEVVEVGPMAGGQGEQAAQLGQADEDDEAGRADEDDAADDAGGADEAGRADEDDAAGTPANGLVALPSFGTAQGFSILASSTVTCTNGSTVRGDVGVSPGIALTGFDASCTVEGTLHAQDTLASAAHEDLLLAFDSLSAAACDQDLTGVELGGLTLPPGVYCFDTTAGVTGELTLDAGGDGSAAWIFQVGSALTTATASSVVMASGGDPCNVFWKVGTAATLGSGSAFKGNILAASSITLTSGSSLEGRALARDAAVTSDDNDVGGCAR